ncbi:MAG: VOC family protein [Armatimonadetes bacterium]|nr:VOC family protein [Akkermansiaceae bacterium]
MNTPSDSYPPFISAIAVQGASEAIDFYQRAFGATERYRLTDSASGKIGHAELDVNGSMFMLSDENPDWNKSPKTLGGTTVKFCLMVENADVSFDRAVAAGATVIMPVSDQFYGYRCGSVLDPYGYEWMLQHVVEKVPHEEMQRRWDNMVKDCKPA